MFISISELLLLIRIIFHLDYPSYFFLDADALRKLHMDVANGTGAAGDKRSAATDQATLASTAAISPTSYTAIDVSPVDGNGGRKRSINCDASTTVRNSEIIELLSVIDEESDDKNQKQQSDSL